MTSTKGQTMNITHHITTETGEIVPAISRAHETQTPLYITRVSDVQPAVVPSDGGRWVIYCDHFDAQTGEWYNAALLQDDNKRRLASWIRAKRGAGFTEWCEECQIAHEHYTQAGA